MTKKYLAKLQPTGEKKSYNRAGHIINDQEGTFFTFFKQADPKKWKQGWNFFPKS